MDYYEIILFFILGVLFIGKKDAYYFPFRLIFKLIYKEAFPKKKDKSTEQPSSTFNIICYC